MVINSTRRYWKIKQSNTFTNNSLWIQCNKDVVQRLQWWYTLKSCNSSPVMDANTCIYNMQFREDPLKIKCHVVDLKRRKQAVLHELNPQWVPYAVIMYLQYNVVQFLKLCWFLFKLTKEVYNIRTQNYHSWGLKLESKEIHHRMHSLKNYWLCKVSLGGGADVGVRDQFSTPVWVCVPQGGDKVSSWAETEASRDTQKDIQTTQI